MPAAFRITAPVVAVLSRIDQSLGRLKGLDIEQPQPQLRKRNRVRTVHSSAAIEGNRLTVDQVTAILEGKRVLGRAQDIKEIENVNAVYERLGDWKATSPRSLLEAHALLMSGLMANPGRFRTTGVGVFRGDRLAHLAPPAHLVTSQVKDLCRWLARTDTPALVAGAVVHYELLFIHPFLDGNGRIARLWQQVVHRAHSPLLPFVPVESLIRDRQAEYYRRLRLSDRNGDCTAFVEFTLAALADSLEELTTEVRPTRRTPGSRIEEARTHFARRWFSRRDYLRLHVKLSTATASRDLAQAVSEGLLRTRGELRFTEYRFQARSGR